MNKKPLTHPFFLVTASLFYPPHFPYCVLLSRISLKCSEKLNTMFSCSAVTANWTHLNPFNDLWGFVTDIFHDVLQTKQSWIPSRTSIRNSRIKLKVFCQSTPAGFIDRVFFFRSVQSSSQCVVHFQFSFSHWGFQIWWGTGVWIWSLLRGDFQNFILVCFGCGCLKRSTQTEQLKTAPHVEK